MSDDWNFYLHHTPLNTLSGTGRITECTQMDGVRMKYTLTEGATLDFELPGSHPATASYQMGTTDILAYRGDRPMQRFRITGFELSHGEDGTSTVSFSAKSYRLLLDGWLIHDTATRTFAAVEQTAIANTLISEAEARINEQWNLTRGTMPTTNVPRDRGAAVDPADGLEGYDAGAKVGEMVQALSEVDNGFEWDIEPDATNPLTALEFNVWNEGLRKQHAGATSDFVLDYGGTVAELDVSGDMSEYANVIRVVGKVDTAENKDGATGPVAWLDESAGTGYGRIERTISVDAVTQEGVDEAAAAEMARWSAGVPMWQITLDAGRWSPDALWIGDHAKFVGDVDYLGSLDLVKRVYEVDVTLSSDGSEIVTMAIGRPSFDPVREQLALWSRIAKLERK